MHDNVLQEKLMPTIHLPELAQAASAAQEHVPLWLEYVKVIGTPIVSLIAAIVGLRIASQLTEERDNKKEHRRIEKESVYIAILLTAHLEKLIQSCLMVAYDDGTEENQPAGGDGLHQVTVSTPVFEPLQIDADWRSLPVELMQGILELPDKIDRLNRCHYSIYAEDFPPDFADFFEARQYDYAQLGLETTKLMFDLRGYAGIPLKAPKANVWSRDQMFNDKIKKIEENRQAYQERVKARNLHWQSTGQVQGTSD
jgi:hypothetical protein